MATRSLNPPTAQTEVQGEANLELDPTSTTGDDFLTREKAVLGDDADQFSSSNDIDAFGGDNDLLGGDGGAPAGEEVTEFESSFPEISTQNEVRFSQAHVEMNIMLTMLRQ